MKTKIRLTKEMEQSLDDTVHTLHGVAERDSNTLYEAGVRRVRDLLNCCPDTRKDCVKGPLRSTCDRIHLKDIRQFGDVAMKSVFVALEHLGFRRYG